MEKLYGINIAWKFEGMLYPSYEDFSKAVIRYNYSLDKNVEEDLQEIITDNEFFSLTYDNRCFGERFVCTVKAKDKAGITVGEALWKLNNYLSGKKVLSRHKYFEGIYPDGYVRLGS